MARLLIDTDTGIDDSIAIIMALRTPGVEVEGLTTVGGNVHLPFATQNALLCVEMCGSDAPVYEGAAAPLLRDLETAEHIHGRDGLGGTGLAGGRTPAEGRAVDVLVDTILANPGEITLVALGPLTNVAIALSRAPEVAGALDRLVIMGGTGVDGPGNVTALAEYNFYADPEAARIVLRSGAPIELVGWDVSYRYAEMTPERQEQLTGLGSDFSRFAVAIQGDMIEFLAHVPSMDAPSLPDPIAMAHAIDPSVATTVEMPVAVVAGDGEGRGAMAVDHMNFFGAPTTATIVTEYPSDRFWEILLAAFAE